jgi:excisionase family DNA binding protein
MLLTMNEAAQLLKLTRGQLYELTRNRCRIRMANPIPVVKLGKRRMFRRESLETWIRTLEQNAQRA